MKADDQPVATHMESILEFAALFRPVKLHETSFFRVSNSSVLRHLLIKKVCLESTFRLITHHQGLTIWALDHILIEGMGILKRLLKDIVFRVLFTCGR